MSKRMLLHDLRLEGGTPSIAQNTHKVTANDEVDQIVAWVGAYARSQGGLDELIIMCHGYEGHADLRNQASTTRAAGGFGLQLGKQGLTLYNVGLVRAWRDPSPAITKITIYACASAETGNNNEGTAADGQRFLGEMALHSGATVIGSSATQEYTRGRFAWLPFSSIDFGEWEGQVFSFSPETGVPSRITPGPMN